MITRGPGMASQLELRAQGQNQQGMRLRGEGSFPKVNGGREIPEEPRMACVAGDQARWLVLGVRQESQAGVRT